MTVVMHRTITAMSIVMILVRRTGTALGCKRRQVVVDILCMVEILHGRI